uniref:Non-specific protein-tyrosine kinase n=1 Tax=Globodera pallida TaxID=36090 RepID=A0A183BIB2_GLOPA
MWSQNNSATTIDVGKLVAIFAYESQSDGDLEFQKGDVMYLQDSSNPEWWFVRNTKGRTGFVPRHFIAFAKTPQAKEWFSGRIPRGVAERLVVDNHLPTRDMDPAPPCFIQIIGCIERADGLCHVLTIPAPRMAVVTLEMFGLDDGAKSGHKNTEAGNDVTGCIFEANIMKQCSHNNLVRLFAVCTKEEPFFIITEYMPNGSLLSYLRAQETDEQGESYGRPKNPLSMQSMVDICAQVASGMKYLEERKLVHRDLAARNVLVGDKISGVPVVKVADFGLARKLMEEDIYEASAGTAPEAAIQGSFTVKSDVWSYGILLYEIFTRGAIPYSDLNNKEVIEQVVIGHRLSCPRAPEPDKQELLNRIFEQLMLKCWDENPDCRPTFEALYHYFDDFFVSQQTNYIPP